MARTVGLRELPDFDAPVVIYQFLGSVRSACERGSDLRWADRGERSPAGGGIAVRHGGAQAKLALTAQRTEHARQTRVFQGISGGGRAGRGDEGLFRGARPRSRGISRGRAGGNHHGDAEFDNEGSSMMIARQASGRGEGSLVGPRRGRCCHDRQRNPSGNENARYPRRHGLVFLTRHRPWHIIHLDVGAAWPTHDSPRLPTIQPRSLLH